MNKPDSLTVGQFIFRIPPFKDQHILQVEIYDPDEGKLERTYQISHTDLIKFRDFIIKAAG